jgi:exopolysaccharide biosynthesis polyprenyl glycosylphosphotransferase
LVLADAVGILATLVLIRALRLGLDSMTTSFAIGLAFAPLIWVGVFHGFSLYNIHHLTGPEEFRRIFSATSAGVLLIMLFGFWWEQPTSPAWLGLTWGVALLLELVIRRLVRWYMRHLRREGPLSMTTLIVGANDEARRLAEVLTPPLGFSAIGFVATSADDVGSELELPVLGKIGDLRDTIKDLGAECVFVASSSVSEEEIPEIYRACRFAGVEIMISANLPVLITSRLTVQPIGKVMALSVRSAGLSGTQAVIKRVFDLVGGTLGLLLSLPLMALIAGAIRVTSRGPVFFAQRRVTQGGREFTMYKFRTMVADADRSGHVPIAELTQPFFKIGDDPRLTSVGRVLRPLSMDELPQLWNVVRGDMSLVGPRPLPVEQVRSDPDAMAARHEVKAGLTGWWQVHGRSDLTLEEALRLDLFYIENWSLSLDLYITLKTVGAILRRRGAY